MKNSLQILVGYASAQGDRYMVVYLYTEDGLQIIIKQAYTEMILANLTGGEGTQDLVLALPAEQEGGGLNLQLLTNTEDAPLRQTLRLVITAAVRPCTRALVRTMATIWWWMAGPVLPAPAWQVLL